MKATKYWLQAENDRNTRHGQVFIELIQRAFGVDEVVLVGHHFVFEPKGSMQDLDLSKLNEIPSADTLIFDHEIMGAVFGNSALSIMTRLACTRAEERDEILKTELAMLPRMANAEATAAEIEAATVPWEVE